MKNIKISVGLLIVLTSFTLMLILSSGLGLYFLHRSNNDIQTLSYNAGEQKALNAVRDAILRARIIIDSAAQAKTHGDDIDEPAVQESVRNELQTAAQQYQMFVKIPGLSTIEPEVGARMKDRYDQQVSVLNHNTDQVININDPLKLKTALADSSRATLQARQAWDNEYHSYIDTTQHNLNQVINFSNSSYHFALLIMIAMLILAGVLFIIINIWMRKMLILPLQEVAQHFEYIGKGDLTGDIHVANRNEIGMLFGALQTMQAELNSTVVSIRQGVESINIGTQEISSGNGDLSRRTEEQAAAVVETAASMEQITATVKQNTDNALQASQMVQNAAGIANEGEEQMRDMMKKMDAISQSAQKMVEIISVIDSIAFQTNILALNAAVEAARAGQSGRGFAVVAGEVRNLARRCTDSAKEISTLINESTLYIQEGAELANKTSRTMLDISGAVSKVNVMMENIALASEEQSRGVEQIRVAITQMDHVTQQNAALVEEVATTASGVNEQANLLSRSVSLFKVKEIF
ncbi:methyl-accepting chemotaxis protein [Lelliottia aquatilis]|uniref:methyl-accepting chemotaxis protein n=1 Tax=Lelliottia aquatilis TaxID=2080838 RepID=UPI001FAF394E|nr:methyl-accepting chemotaxis protein [Lelliottia aquatilis]